MAVLKYRNPATGQVQPVDAPVHTHDSRYYTKTQVDEMIAAGGGGGGGGSPTYFGAADSDPSPAVYGIWVVT